MLQCHPDKVRDESLQAEKAEQYQMVQDAYDVLSNEERKRLYDMDMSEKGQPKEEPQNTDPSPTQERCRFRRRPREYEFDEDNRRHRDARPARSMPRDGEIPRREQPEHRDERPARSMPRDGEMPRREQPDNEREPGEFNLNDPPTKRRRGTSQHRAHSANDSAAPCPPCRGPSCRHDPVSPVWGEPLDAAGRPIRSRQSYESARPSFPGSPLRESHGASSPDAHPLYPHRRPRGDFAYSSPNQPATPGRPHGKAPAIIRSITER